MFRTVRRRRSIQHAEAVLPQSVIDGPIAPPYNQMSAVVTAHPHNVIAASSFNGRTADSGSAYRGSNPWGAAKSFQALPSPLSLTLCLPFASCLRIVADWFPRLNGQST